MSERELDQQLVERVQAGDTQAFGLLVVKYQRRVQRLLSRFVRTPQDVDELTQEAFIKAYRALPNFRGESAFYTWLYRIAINTAKNALQANSRRQDISLYAESEDGETFFAESLLSSDDDPERRLQNKQVLEHLQRAIGELPPWLAQALTLREFEGLSYEEIALAMDCPIGTVRSRIFRAREAIAEKLKDVSDEALFK